MSVVRPMEIAAPELERQTLPRKPRSNCASDFGGTGVSLLVSFPILLSVYYIVCRIIATSGPYCDLLTQPYDPFRNAFCAGGLIFSVVTMQLFCGAHRGYRVAAAAMALVLVAGVSIVSGFPNLEGKTSFGLFRNSSIMGFAQNNNHSRDEYWNRNIKTCVCKNEACEDVVYRDYLSTIYGIDADEGFGFGLDYFTKVDAKNMKMGNSSSSGQSSDSRYHEVCYRRSSGNYWGNKTLCYDCYACEDKYLSDLQRWRWGYGNKLCVLGLLLVASNAIVFVAESWARYLG